MHLSAFFCFDLFFAWFLFFPDGIICLLSYSIKKRFLPRSVVFFSFLSLAWDIQWPIGIWKYKWQSISNNDGISLAECYKTCCTSTNVCKYKHNVGQIDTFYLNSRWSAQYFAPLTACTPGICYYRIVLQPEMLNPSLSVLILVYKISLLFSRTLICENWIQKWNSPVDTLHKFLWKFDINLS